MPRGGKRVGAGRPPGIHTKHKSTLERAVEKEELRKLLAAKVAKEWEPMIDAHIKHAKGISYMVYRAQKGGKFTKVTAETDLEALQASGEVVVEVWEKDPSVQSFTDLANRTIDKPAEQEIPVTFPQGITIQWKK